MRCWARLSRAPATIFWARVIFWGFLTLPMRLRSDFRSGTARSSVLRGRSGLLGGGDEAFAEGLEEALELRLQLVGDGLLVADRLPDVGVLRVDVRVELRLVLGEGLDRELVQEALGAGVDDDDLLLH